MNAVAELVTSDPQSGHLALDATLIDTTVKRVCARIAPNWPLDRAIAVNPFWHWIERPFAQVADRLAHLDGIRMYMPLSYYQQQWQQGIVRRDHLAQAISESHHSHYKISLAEVVAGLEQDDALIAQPLLSDVLDSRRDVSHAPRWRDVITHQISQLCAAYFDHHQSDWRSLNEQGLYAHWREMIARDHGIGLLMGSTQCIRRAQLLPADATSAIHWVINKLQINASQLEDVLLTVLLRIKGWASWCAYLRWQARLQGGDDNQLVELLAVRLSWEWLLDDGHRDDRSIWNAWQSKHASSDMSLHAMWQRALEIACQQQLAATLRGHQQRSSSATTSPNVQAVFCIDVRSETMRRALEAVDDGIATMGFAGFFGVPLSYAPLGTDLQRPQLPGLLAPAIKVTESCGHAEGDAAIQSRRRERLKNQYVWKLFTRMPSSAFTLVESLGIGYLNKLVTRGLFNRGAMQSVERAGLSAQQLHCLHPVISNDDCKLETQVALAERILNAMSLKQGFARLILLAGHGSETSNNPQAAALACGACGGQSGEVNARVVAALLNDRAVRDELNQRGIFIPGTTWFVAGLHNTTTQEVVLLDTMHVPDTHVQDLKRLQSALIKAAQQVRSELAPSLGLSHLSYHAEALERAFKSRARDWSQLRPEWGLANNAAFIVAPRSMTRGLNLAGRAFLHDYNWQQDADNSVLELIMTAPMLVTNWINMQYYASTVDNVHFGSGNKILHNVVGGHIGVFEGNGGDLRFGLSMQSLHDGEKWMHQPLRLNVYVAAPRDRIEKIVRQHDSVRHLIDNDWLYLFRIDDDEHGRRIERLYHGEWSEFR